MVNNGFDVVEDVVVVDVDMEIVVAVVVGWSIEGKRPMHTF